MDLNEISAIIYKKLTLKNDLRQVRMIYNIYQVYKCLVYLPLLWTSTIVLTIFAMPVIWLFGERAGQISGILWARFNSFTAPMWLSVEGGEQIAPGQSYVIMANHQSGFDIFAVYGWMPVDFRWVMKAELRRVPVLGYYCYKAGHIFIDRSDHNAAVESINSAKERIKEGTSIMFFPEGTRSDNGQLMEFKKGAFIFALETGLPVLPVTISGTRNILPPGTMSLFPGQAKITIHKPVKSAEYTQHNIEKFIQRVRKAINSSLEA